ncbi:hypothetical protein LINGRAHAP2_LOCUS24038 [Linum grandiflorum]
MSLSSSIIVSTTTPSNLMRFIHSITHAPVSKSSIYDLNRPLEPLQNEIGIDYFIMADVWKCYEEFSAYGVGTTVSLCDNDYATQYYATYLSSIQLYTNKSFSASRSSGGHDDDSLELEKDSTNGDTNIHNSGKSSHDNVYSGLSCMEDKLGSPYLLFIESCSPNNRVPLWKKMAELAAENPGLMTLTSVDLSPASWMSIACRFKMRAYLWKCHKGFSAFGAETTVSLGVNDYATQYYTPCLSGIQLYTNKPFSASRSDNSLGVENDSIDGDTNNHNFGKPPHDSVSSGSLHTEDKLGSLYLLFIESCSPNYRVPLYKKVADLESKADDTHKRGSLPWKLDVCCLLHHGPLHGAENVINDAYVDAARAATRSKVIRDDGNVGIPLPPFGLGTFNMHKDLWIADAPTMRT